MQTLVSCVQFVSKCRLKLRKISMCCFLTATKMQRVRPRARIAKYWQENKSSAYTDFSQKTNMLVISGSSHGKLIKTLGVSTINILECIRA